MKNFGLFLIGVGIAWALFAFNMGTTVQTGGERIGSGDYSIYIPRSEVHNLGLMETKRTHLMLSGLCAVIGVILFGFGSLARRNDADDLMQCTECAELVQPEARKCRFCGADLTIEQAADVGTDTEAKLVDDLGITYDGKKYYFGQYSYENLADAISQAKYQAMRDQQV